MGNRTMKRFLNRVFAALRKMGSPPPTGRDEGLVPTPALGVRSQVKAGFSIILKRVPN